MCFLVMASGVCFLHVCGKTVSLYPPFSLLPVLGEDKMDVEVLDISLSS